MMRPSMAEEGETPYIPETLEDCANLIETLHHDILFGFDTAGADLISSHHFIQALSFLQLAQSEVKLAQLFQTRAIADRGRT